MIIRSIFQAHMQCVCVCEGGGGGGGEGAGGLTGPIISKSCSFSPDTEFTPLTLDSKSEFAPHFLKTLKFAPSFSKVCIQAYIHCLCFSTESMSKGLFLRSDKENPLKYQRRLGLRGPRPKPLLLTSRGRHRQPSFLTPAFLLDNQRPVHSFNWGCGVFYLFYRCHSFT